MNTVPAASPYPLRAIHLLLPLGALILASGFAQLRTSGVQPGDGGDGGGPAGRFVIGGDAGRTVEVTPPRRGPISTTIQAAGTVQAGSEVGVSAPFEGTVLEIVHDEGDAVAEGAVVFRLDPRDKGEAVTEARIDLARKEASLAEARFERDDAAKRKAEAADEPEAVTEARLQVRQKELGLARTRAQLDSAQAALSRAEQMLREGIGRQVDVESASSEHHVARIGVRIAEEDLSLSRELLVFRTAAWGRSRLDADKALALADSVLTRSEADLRGARLALTRAERDLARCDVTSPLAGVVTARAINRGDLVTRPPASENHTIVSDLANLFVYADVDEGDVVHVQERQPTRVTVHALDDQPLLGTVYDVALRASQREGEEVKQFRVRVLLDPSQAELTRLRPGMSASVEIETGRAAEALKVPLQAVLRRERRELPKGLRDRLPEALRAPFDALPTADDALVDLVYVAVADGDGAVARLRVLDLGLLDADEAQVEAGLEPDAHVIVGPYRALEELSDGDPVIGREADAALLTTGDGDAAAVDSGS